MDLYIFMVREDYPTQWSSASSSFHHPRKTISFDWSARGAARGLFLLDSYPRTGAEPGVGVLHPDMTKITSLAGN